MSKYPTASRKRGSIATPRDHALALHGSGEGHVALGQKIDGGRWQEQTYRTDELSKILPALGTCTS